MRRCVWMPIGNRSDVQFRKRCVLNILISHLSILVRLITHQANSIVITRYLHFFSLSLEATHYKWHWRSSKTDTSNWTVLIQFTRIVLFFFLLWRWDQSLSLFWQISDNCLHPILYSSGWMERKKLNYITIRFHTIQLPQSPIFEYNFGNFCHFLKFNNIFNKQLIGDVHSEWICQVVQTKVIIYCSKPSFGLELSNEGDFWQFLKIQRKILDSFEFGAKCR